MFRSSPCNDVCKNVDSKFKIGTKNGKCKSLYCFYDEMPSYIFKKILLVLYYKEALRSLRINL